MCEVYLDGISTNIHIHGQVLEKAVHIYGNCYLVFTTDGVIFEESLNIYLIEVGKGVLDKLWIGRPYDTDTFTGYKIVDEQTLIFFIFVIGG
ncbi:hypothetical protein [Acinetobacter sp. ANC 3832]|uniref:hypothetical protein n=1 Tax=Acinetobacter sp. ANC 3832 TaxID=1977874 RepID=UPI000A34457B|nr:hypothetical protein [Acinetobacter sp. ANC 3832]OTG87794.1 hypothetical protein B9T35_17445 [Acinetobacter sp. ANC 3832]